MPVQSQSRKYTATLTNSGRAGWSVIFRHPVVVDPATGHPPLRIKRGLGTVEEEKAKAIINDLNTLLSDQSYWSLAARTVAIPRFQPKAVDIFFSPMEREELNFAAMREKFIQMPPTGSEYRSMLLIGTTGAGKTTLVRQILGTDPQTERFPSISASRCTIAETEIHHFPWTL